MSYDLYLKPRAVQLDENRFFDYFRARRNCTIDKAQVVYQNEDTGVYFLVDWNESPHDEEKPHFPIAININYNRPSFFIFEAEPEITALVRQFDLVVFDPQSDGMGEGEYRQHLLISGWNAGNAFAIPVILRELRGSEKVRTLPSARLREIWSWNYKSHLLQSSIGESTFVPRIMFFEFDDQLVTMAIWLDATPILLPRVDYLFIGRQELAPRRFFRRSEDVAIVPWTSAEELLKQYGAPHGSGATMLDYSSQPPAVRRFVQDLPSNNRPLTMISCDRVLDRELVGKHMI